MSALGEAKARRARQRAIALARRSTHLETGTAMEGALRLTPAEAP